MPDTGLQLRDIHLPDSPSFWPPAPGWWIVFALLVMVLLWAVVVWRRRIARKRQQQRLMALFDQLPLPARKGDTPAYLTELSSLLRRLAVAKYGRRRVAPLKGSEWLEFLGSTLEPGGAETRSSEGHLFDEDMGRLLSEGPYRPPQEDSGEPPGPEEEHSLRKLAGWARRWMENNSNGGER